jgi:hypothetical protein
MASERGVGGRVRASARLERSDADVVGIEAAALAVGEREPDAEPGGVRPSRGAS